MCWRKFYAYLVRAVRSYDPGVGHLCGAALHDGCYPNAVIGLNKEPRLRFTDEERSDPVLEKPIRKAEKAAARADKAQDNIPKKKVRQMVIDPDTGKKTSKLTFEDKKKPPSKVSQGVKEAPVHLVAGKLHKEIRENEQDNVGVGKRPQVRGGGGDRRLSGAGGLSQP